ncbi:hypothetical protein D3C71_1275410 [compost metagenome]
MFACLRHHAVITRHDQQSVIDTAHPGQHIGEKLFVSWHIDKPEHAAIGLRPVGIAKIDSHTALFLFRQTVGIHAGNRL